jgi:hypothetical protein
LILAPDPDRWADPLAALDTDGTITAESFARTRDRFTPPIRPVRAGCQAADRIGALALHSI